MYIKYDKNAEIETGRYLCVVKFGVGEHIDYDYTIADFYNNEDEASMVYDFKEKGFYVCDDHDWFEYLLEDVVAYKPIEQYVLEE